MLVAKEALLEGSGQPRGLQPGLGLQRLWSGIGLSVQWQGRASVIEQNAIMLPCERYHRLGYKSTALTSHQGQVWQEGCWLPCEWDEWPMSKAGLNGVLL